MHLDFAPRIDQQGCKDISVPGGCVYWGWGHPGCSYCSGPLAERSQHTSPAWGRRAAPLMHVGGKQNDTRLLGLQRRGGGAGHGRRYHV